ncbi:MAG: pitrilysin family protein, partial [Xanthomonadales bacterium]|nr:pitrilysin family protein [Xanthomonadales bacterium]
MADGLGITAREPSRRGRLPGIRWVWLIVGLLAGSLPGAVLAALDLSAAVVERLENGLTVITLNEPAFPVVSVQMLYRAGAKHEAAGATGLAHFLEHMAFRDSENFPGTRLVGAIYAAGGEWHGYTWLDQTTYFATAPAAELELLLRIEADRMARLLIPEDKVEAERGAILAEMHGYENDPSSVLHDYLLYQSFLAHPYRNNTIGWERDIQAISHAELVAFYRRHYHAGNAVLAVVGDIEHEAVMRLVRRHFAGLRGTRPSPEPHTAEPEQTGERRLRLRGVVARKHFKIAYRAPAAAHPDYAGFLLLQDLLAAGSGASFLQNDWGTPARPGSPLAGVGEDLVTWFPPSKQNYVFTIGGSLAAGDGGQGDEQVGSRAEDAVEAGIESGIGQLRRALDAADGSAEALVAAARGRVRRELALDVRTTEDAAHQLAFFSGIDALDVLIGLPAALERVGPADIARLIDDYLGR